MATCPVSTGIVWFRRDLRLGDNPALRAALDAHDHVVALFVHDPALVGPSGANRVAYLHATLDALHADLDGLLVERHGDPTAVVTALAAEVEADEVHIAEDFGPYGRRRDDEVEIRLAAEGRTLVRTGSPYAVPPGSVATKGGTPFKVGIANEANVLARYVGGDKAVISGLMTGADSLKSRPFAVDVPNAYKGMGRVIMFSNNPIYRWQNHGEFNMIFNSVINWNDAGAPATPPSPAVAPRP